MGVQISDRFTCHEAWLLTVRDWEMFNAVCTNLREFDWVVVPFGDPCFCAFGEHVKPHLKTLTLGVNMNWNWRWNFHDKSEAAGPLPGEDWQVQSHCERSGYGFLATEPDTALKGCPMLDELIIRLHHPVDPDVRTNEDDNDTSFLPDQEMVNADVFGDHFIETLTMHCPYLTHLAVIEAGECYTVNDLVPIRTFTDQGLLALTRLKYLCSLELRSINCTAKGIFDFLNSQSREFTGNRTFQITVGGSDTAVRFYEVLTELLTQLAETSDLACARQKFAFRLENWSRSSSYTVGYEWSQTYLRELNELMRRVNVAHPSLRQHVVAENYNGVTFSRIAEFGLYSVHANRDLYIFWEDWNEEPGNESITIVNRVSYDNDESDPSGQEYYDDYDDYDDSDDFCYEDEFDEFDDYGYEDELDEFDEFDDIDPEYYMPF